MEKVQRSFNKMVEDDCLDELLEATRKSCSYRIYKKSIKLPVYLDKEDVMQDAMLKVFKAYNQFNPSKASANTYFSRIIDNAITDHVRNSWNQVTGQGFSATIDRLRSHQYANVADGGGLNSQSLNGSTQNSSEKREQIEETVGILSSETEADYLFSELLTDLKDELTSREKEIFILRYEGYTHEEIAEKLGLSRPTIAKEWGRVRKIILDWIY